MSEDTTKPKAETSDSDQDEEMLEEYDFSKAKPGRYRGAFQGQLIRVLEDGSEQVINTKAGFQPDRSAI
jgi:hypothetical protein